MKKTTLLILDGWGLGEPVDTNAVFSARSPVLDELAEKYPRTSLACSGRSVGLPDGFMGNSEVGHMNIGAGRIIYQDMTRIDMAIEDGSFAKNPVILGMMDTVKRDNETLHLMGLLSDGGVHSHINHLFALLELAKAHGVARAAVHAFMDGRDTPPTSGIGYMRQLVARMDELGYGRVATVSGRYWAMDRDSHFERNKLAYDAMVNGIGVEHTDPVAAVQAAYDDSQTDEFIKPVVIVEDGAPVGSISSDDVLYNFNFRADRARQITRAFFDNDFDGFDRGDSPAKPPVCTMTRYDSTFPLPVAFPPQTYDKVLGQVISEAGLKQLRLAETEKYAHVTYFFNCGREEPFEGEDRIMIPSPRDVATYDLKPEMSAEKVTETYLEKWRDYDLCVVNLANLDMVGHTGILEAAKSACETVDKCVGRIVEEVLAGGGRVLLTADHGNSEEMVDKNGQPHTAHTTNPVPLVLIDDDMLDAGLEPGKLGDIAPTILALMELGRPMEMTGENLVGR